MHIAAEAYREITDLRQKIDEQFTQYPVVRQIIMVVVRNQHQDLPQRKLFKKEHVCRRMLIIASHIGPPPRLHIVVPI